MVVRGQYDCDNLANGAKDHVQLCVNRRRNIARRDTTLRVFCFEKLHRHAWLADILATVDAIEPLIPISLPKES